MSLIAWYKLDGDVTDSSGNGYNGTASNLTYSTGKIGQGGSFNGTSSYFQHANPGISGKNCFTVSFWMYPTVANAAKILTPRSTGHDQYIVYGVNKNIYVHIAESADLNERDLYTPTDSVPLNAWTHVVVIMDDLRVKIYINGILQLNLTQTIPIAPWIDTWYWGVRGTAYAGYYAGLLDDIKVYNSILSQKEVKELSKAKVLHYDFDDFQEPTTNLLTNPILQNSADGWSISNYNNQTPYTFGSRDGYNYIHFTYAGAGGTDTYFGIAQSQISISPSTTYNYSVKLEGSSAFLDNILTSVGNSQFYAELRWYTSADVYISKSEPVAGNIIRLNDITTLISFSATSPSNAAKSVFYCTFDAPDLNTGQYCIIYQPQLEAKDHATPFVNDSRTGIVRDVSGYNNDAALALATTPQWTEDIKIGEGAYKTVNSSNTYIQTPFGSEIDMINKYSFSMWVKPLTLDNQMFFNTENGTNQRVYFAINTNKWDMGIQGNGWGSGAVTAAILNEWTHIVVVFDGSYAKMYINGVFSFQKAYTSYIPANNFKLCSRSDYASNNILDDVRIYATALDSSDILELYQTRAQIDKNGNFYSIEFVEHDDYQIDTLEYDTGSYIESSFLITDLL